MTKKELKALSNSSLIKMFELSCYQSIYRQQLAESDPEIYLPRYKEIVEEISMYKNELQSRLDECSE